MVLKTRQSKGSVASQAVNASFCVCLHFLIECSDNAVSVLKLMYFGAGMKQRGSPLSGEEVLLLLLGECDCLTSVYFLLCFLAFFQFFALLSSPSFTLDNTF